jgi:porphyrinogen peroxidase
MPYQTFHLLQTPGHTLAAGQGTPEDPPFAGGTYVIVQKYVHDMAAWEALAVEEQERVIGRAKLSNVEMDDDVKLSNSHVALNTIVEAEGTQRQILRENMPFGSLGAAEFGTYFIGYAATPSVTELMLEHMFLGDPPGNYDRILDFSTAMTGTLFFVPTADFLDDPPPKPGDGADAASAGVNEEVAGAGSVSGDRAAGGDGSLRIGGLAGMSPLRSWKAHRVIGQDDPLGMRPPPETERGRPEVGCT